MNILTITQPDEEPLSLVTAKQHCRIETADSDAILQGYIAAARLRVEAFTRLKLVSQTVQVRFSGFSYGLRIPTAPVQAVTAVQYLDAAGVPQVVDPANYRVDQSGALARLIPATGFAWPVTLNEPDTVYVTCEVGYGAASDVPAHFVVAMQLLVGHYYENREATLVGFSAEELPFGVKDILQSHIVWI